MTKSIKLVLASLVTSHLNQFTLAASVEDASVRGVDALLADGDESVKTESADAAKPTTGKFMGPGHIEDAVPCKQSPVPRVVPASIGSPETVLVHDDFSMHDFGHHDVHDHYGRYAPHDRYDPYDRQYDHYDPYHPRGAPPGLLTHAAENLEGGWSTFKHVLAHWTRNMGSTMGRLGHGLHRAGQQAHAMSHVGYAHDHYSDPYGHADPYGSYGHVDAYDHFAHGDPYARAAYHDVYSPYVHAVSHSPVQVVMPSGVQSLASTD